MYSSPYSDPHGANDLSSLMDEIYGIADNLRKATNNAVVRRTGAQSNPMAMEYVGGLTTILHDRIQHYIMVQARTLKVEEAERITITKVEAISRLIKKSQHYVSGVGSEADYLVAEVFRSGIQEVMSV